MIIPVDKETKHIKDRNYDTQGYSEHEVTYKNRVYQLKGCGMGPWLVLVSPCFRENVVATCRIGSVLCSLDNLLQKNVIVLFFGNQIFKMALIEKWAIFDLLFTFSSHQGKIFKNSSSTYLTHIHTRILLTLLTFLPYQF